MRKLLSKAVIVFLLAIGPVAYAHAQCTVSWNQEISSQADHVTCSAALVIVTPRISPRRGFQAVVGMVQTVTCGGA